MLIHDLGIILLALSLNIFFKFIIQRGAKKETAEGEDWTELYTSNVEWIINIACILMVLILINL